MKIRVIDLPVGGEDFEFKLNLSAVNQRAYAPTPLTQDSSILPPLYEFIEEPNGKLHLELEGLTVFIEGFVSGRYKTECARCGENTLKALTVPVKLILKPFRSDEKKGEQVEDLGFGFYDGQFVDCAEIAEEFLMLALPFNDLCSEDCHGLCPKCGVNLNISKCNCSTNKEPDPRFAILQKIKVQ